MLGSCPPPPVCGLMGAVVQDLITHLAVSLFLRYSEAPPAGQMGWQWGALVPKMRALWKQNPPHRQAVPLQGARCQEGDVGVRGTPES